jgi:hypothetical protein
VKAVRSKTGLTQDGFANTFGFSTGSVRDWEQGRVQPDQAARAYLYVIGKKPEIVRETLKAGDHVTIKGVGTGRVVGSRATQADAVESASSRKGSRKQKRPPAFASERKLSRSLTHGH